MKEGPAPLDKLPPPESREDGQTVPVANEAASNLELALQEATTLADQEAELQHWSTETERGQALAAEAVAQEEQSSKRSTNKDRSTAEDAGNNPPKAWKVMTLDEK